MKLSQKRTCTGCRAADYENGEFNGCLLGYGIQLRESVSTFYDQIPLQPCKKPLTALDFNILMQGEGVVVRELLARLNEKIAYWGMFVGEDRFLAYAAEEVVNDLKDIKKVATEGRE